jgi:hypothetical protein
MSDPARTVLGVRDVVFSVVSRMALVSVPGTDFGHGCSNAIFGAHSDVAQSATVVIPCSVISTVVPALIHSDEHTVRRVSGRQQHSEIGVIVLSIVPRLVVSSVVKVVVVLRGSARGSGWMVLGVQVMPVVSTTVLTVIGNHIQRSDGLVGTTHGTQSQHPKIRLHSVNVQYKLTRRFEESVVESNTLKCIPFRQRRVDLGERQLHIEVNFAT